MPAIRGVVALLQRRAGFVVPAALLVEGGGLAGQGKQRGGQAGNQGERSAHGVSSTSGEGSLSEQEYGWVMPIGRDSGFRQAVRRKFPPAAWGSEIIRELLGVA